MGLMMLLVLIIMLSLIFVLEGEIDGEVEVIYMRCLKLFYGFVFVSMKVVLFICRWFRCQIERELLEWVAYRKRVSGVFPCFLGDYSYS